MTREARYFRKIYGATVDQKLLRLLHDASRPIVALRIRHGSWIVPHDELASFSISAAQKMVRRAFDSLYHSKLVAVGLFTVFVDSTDYMIELRLIVAGAEQPNLERAFRDARAEPVKSIRGAIDDMLNGTAEAPTSSGPWTTVRPYSQRVEPGSKQWPEYMGWLKAHFRRLVFRYGCDRYWNRLQKEPRLLKSKVNKRHPTPSWLEPFQFGGDFWGNQNIDRTRRRKRAPDTGMDYFNLEDEDE